MSQLSLDDLFACIQHITDDANRGFWMKLGSSLFEQLVKIAQTFKLNIGDRSELTEATVGDNLILKAAATEFQKLADQIGLVVKGGEVHIESLNISAPLHRQVGLQGVKAGELESTINQTAKATGSGNEQIGATGLDIKGKAVINVTQKIE